VSGRASVVVSLIASHAKIKSPVVSEREMPWRAFCSMKY